MRGRRRIVAATLTVTAVSAGLFALGTIAGPTSKPAAPSRGPVDTAAADPLSAAIAAEQATLAHAPGDYRTWAALGLAYVQQAKAKVDPSFYAKATGALQRSLDLDRTDNFAGYGGEAALQAALHNFRAARALALRGIAINRYDSTLYGALADAETQLGQYDAAAAAVQRMNELEPGVPAFTRASYVFELRGDVAGAQRALERSLQDATSPGDTSFVDYYLGELSFNYGRDVDKALGYYAAGLAANPRDFACLEGQAKAEAAEGSVPEALRDYRDVVTAVPQPQYVLELAELEQSLHLPDAQRQYQLFRAEERLFTASGVSLDVEPTLFEADHGSPALALQYARRGWQVRPFLEMADAYAWALHVSHSDAAALAWSDRALATGWDNALFRYHRGVIEAALGRSGAARADLARALATNPHFNVLQAPLAVRALRALGG